MGKCDGLDAKILALCDNLTPVFDIWLKLRDEVKDITYIDRRLQALKKKGLVMNVRGCGWRRLAD